MIREGAPIILRFLAQVFVSDSVAAHPIDPHDFIAVLRCERLYDEIHACSNFVTNLSRVFSTYLPRLGSEP